MLDIMSLTGETDSRQRTTEDNDGRQEGVLGIVDSEETHHATEVKHSVRCFTDGR